jgi:2-hydroxy-6-oxonona-2,4-dienedioate hydrolase
VSVPHDYTQDLAGIEAPVLLIHGRYDRMVAFEVSIAILNHIADWHLVLLNNCGHWPPFERLRHGRRSLTPTPVGFTWSGTRRRR